MRVYATHFVYVKYLIRSSRVFSIYFNETLEPVRLTPRDKHSQMGNLLKNEQFVRAGNLFEIHKFYLRQTERVSYIYIYTSELITIIYCTRGKRNSTFSKKCHQNEFSRMIWRSVTDSAGSDVRIHLHLPRVPSHYTVLARWTLKTLIINTSFVITDIWVFFLSHKKKYTPYSHIAVT